MAIELIADYLKRTTGLDSSSVGILVVEQAVNKRMEDCDIADYIEYYRLLQDSKDELNLLIDRVMIPETWFFRGPEAFKLLRENIVNQASSATRKNIRILSIPCATGEEPYSIAMVLKECGYRSNECIIDAADIAQESLRLAKNALYTEHSFRELSDQDRERYFKKINSEYRLSDSIKDFVTFSCKNIFDMEVNGDEKYDIVFCRNLLIYFDKNTQRKTLNKIDTLMSDDGVLFIGHGEAGCIAGSQFKKIDRPNAFAFLKTQNSELRHDRKSLTNNNRVANNTRPPYLIKLKSIQEKAKKADVSNAHLIEDAIKMADEGRLDKAMEQCKKTIQAGGISADVLCLLGVIHDAKDDRQEAIKYYRRAVHLMPGHYQSLMHLASHADRDGDKSKAADYRMKAKQLMWPDASMLNRE